MRDEQPIDITDRRLLIVLAGVGLIGAGLIGWLRHNRTAAAAPLTSYPLPESLIQDPLVDARVIRHANGGLTVRWYIKAETIIVYGGTSPDTIDTEQPMAVTSDVTSVTFNNLPQNQRHYFMIKLVGGERNGDEIRVAERELPMVGAVNFRDIGGYRTRSGRYTRWGMVYRAGNLNQLTPQDQQLLQAVHLQTACDLRTAEEIEEAPDNLPDTITYIGLPLQLKESRRQQMRGLMKYRNQMDAGIIEIYTRIMVDNNAPVFGAAIKEIANAERLPLVVHCTAGKDRTGITVALLLALLDVPDDVIAADYSLSNTHWKVFEAVGAKAIEPLRPLGINTDNMQPLFTANPATITATLTHIRSKYGSVSGYLTNQGGVTSEEIQHLRELLIR